MRMVGCLLLWVAVGVALVALTLYRKRRKMALLASRERFELAMEAAFDGLWDWNIPTNSVFYSPRWMSMLGYDPDELPHNFETFVDLLHPDDSEKALARYQDMLTKPDSYFEQEFRLRTKNGRYRWILSRGRVFKRDRKKRPIRALGTHIDITERKQSEIEIRNLNHDLAASNERFALATQVVSLGVWERDRDRDKTYILDDRTCETYGLPKNTRIPAAEWLNLVHPDDRKSVVDSVRKLKRQGGHDHIEFRIIRPDGTHRDIYAGVILVESGTHEDAKLFGVNWDITERKAAEKALAEAKESAEKSSRIKSEFLANMSHEIRTPMNAVIGMSHLAALTDLTVQQRDYNDKIQNAAKSLLNIINDILDFSKIEAGRLTIEAIDFRLDQVLERIADLFRLKTEEKRIELLFDIKPDVPYGLIGDPLRMEQVLANLIGNAWKFTDQGEIIVRVEMLERQNATATMGFSVQDSGVGIPAEKLNHLFDSFYQVDASTTRIHGGTGLGLAICKQLVTMMGGEIQAESQIGKGSTFRFSAELGIQPQSNIGPYMLSDSIQGKRILVVDDSPIALTILADMLRSFSFDITTASNAQDAFDILDSWERHIDIVIMDWLMPDMNGIEVARTIKRRGYRSSPPVIIIMTAYGQEEVWQEARDLGLVDFLRKPVSPSTIFDAIANVCDCPSSRRQKQLPDKKIATDPFTARVLLVEDNPINRQIARELLENFGVSVDVADDGVEGLKKVQQAHYDIIFMDIQMPIMDGLEAARRIRQAGLTEIPIIAMTAHAMVGDREKSLQAGMNDHIIKPIDPEALYHALDRWLKQDFSGTLLTTNAMDSESVLLPDYPDAIDFQVGLQRIGGNRKFFRKLLKDFYIHHRGDMGEIHQAIAEGRGDDAKRMIHNLKGIGGSIGAAQLQDAASKLEFCLKEQGSDLFTETMNSFEEVFRAVMECLAQLEREP